MLGRRLVGPHGYRISASFLQSVCWVSTKQQITSLSSVAPKWKPLLLGTVGHGSSYTVCAASK